MAQRQTTPNIHQPLSPAQRDGRVERRCRCPGYSAVDFEQDEDVKRPGLAFLRAKNELVIKKAFELRVEG